MFDTIAIREFDIWLVIIIVTGMAYSILAKKLTVLAACTGGLLASLIASAAGFTGLMMMTGFFVLGSVATSWKRGYKKIFVSMAEGKGGRRAGQVLANAGISGFSALVILFYPEWTGLMLLVMATGFSSATADTLASELGMIYGKRFFNILTLKADRCGMDGVISLEGTLIGMCGSCFIALIYGLGFGFDVSFFWIVVAGTIGNLMDSVLGALLERKGLLGNDAVNFLSTLSAAIAMVLLNWIF
ncbi:DUF92 domain-containing protein [Pedobacter sp. Leaf250]|uniref:DUF92 domain-containing protein n=1 Tax=Pedobacter sp. Leaf250 TaxID=2876559 RepID=UPI001E581BAB|nr:DUF92 domain-containing protein [Pedobacter sp. Leaf250]